MNKIHRLQLKHVVSCLMMVTVCLALSGCTSLPPKQSYQPFTFIVLPDTQLYSLHHPGTFVEQTKWIKEQRDELNIVGMIHEGDITHKNTEKEWKAANQAISILDDVVPYCMVLGNHDLGPGGSAQNRNAVFFNKYFGPQRFQGKSWYGGHYDKGNENAFYRIHTGGMDFLILCLEFGPRDEVLEWANKVVADHKHHRTIVVTHCHTYSDDTRLGKGDKWNPHAYGCKGNDGDETWNKFVRKHKNLLLVLSGHVLNDGLGRLVSEGDKGNKVHQILANYQMKRNGGNGWLRIMKFLPAEHKIQISTYSPVLKQYATDAQNQFEIEY